MACLQLQAKPALICDFENEAERNLWVLNPTVNANQARILKNKWYIGTLTNNAPTGQYALYISADENQTIGYSATNSAFSIAYRPLTLTRGTYTMCFDWLANGSPSGADFISVCWVPDNDADANSKLYSSGNSSNIPDWVKRCRVDSALHALTWQTATTKLKITNENASGKLVFVWSNSAGKANNPPACIDNIEILTDRCPAITDVSHTAIDGVVTLSWKGSCDHYTVMVQDYATGQWFNYENITGNSVSINGLSEGVHNFRLRGFCNDGEGDYDMTPFAVYSSFIVFEGTRCIDYLSIHKAQCYIGDAGHIQDNHNRNFVVALVDSGYANAKSRHTVHYVKTETDSRTYDKDNPTQPMLKTVPDDELASVRLGNWLTGGQSERIEYKYFVEEGVSDILKIKYAVVIESPYPGLHAEADQSHFKLDVLDKKGNPIDKECTSADFSAGYGDLSEWHIIPNKGVFWKDWTDVSVSLRNYIGDTLTIRLSTSDCTQQGHYGYAYFTLACETGEIKGLSCDKPTTTFEAPEGFNYRWYREDNPDEVLGRERTYSISPEDTMYYIVDVISKTNPNCYYQLVASGLPQKPVAKAHYATEKRNCQNVVHFNSDSYVRIFNEKRENGQTSWESQTAKVTDMAWDFGDGSPIINTSKSEITHGYPPEGGHFTAVLTTYLSDRLCDDTVQIQLDLPDITVKDFVVTRHLCEGDSWSFNGKTYTEATNDTMTYISSLGCDSSFIVNIYYHDKTPQLIDTLICGRDMPFRFFNGTDTLNITTTGQYRGEFVNQWKCDSIITLNIEIEPLLNVQMADTATVCSDGLFLDVPYALLGGRLDSVCLIMSDVAIDAGFDSEYCFAADEPVSVEMPVGIEPGRYHATIHYITPICQADDKPVIVEVNYPSSIMDQKMNNGWVGVLSKDAENFGFFGYQWYRDGQIVEGANESYIPVSEEDKGHVYTVRITRNGETEGLLSCPVVYGVKTALEDAIYDHSLTQKVIVNGCLYIIREGKSFNVLGSPVKIK